MDVPSNLYRLWELQHADTERSRDRQQQLAKERAITARIWLDRAFKALEGSPRLEAPPR